MGRKSRTQGPLPRAIVLDTGALIALDKGDERMRAIMDLARQGAVRVFIPAGALAQAWRGGARQVLLRALTNMSRVSVFDRAMAEAVGALCAARGTSDVVDGQIVLVALRERANVLSSDLGDLLTLAPNLAVERI